MLRIKKVIQMGKSKEVKTNAMRILDRNKISYEVNSYECEEFIDGIHIADMLGQSYDESFKTLVTKSKRGGFFVFALPINRELDLKKAAKAVGEKSLEMIHVKEINAVTGYIRGGCTPLGMKKDYPTIIHESAMKYERIIISGGRIGSQIIVNPNDLIKVTNARYEDIVEEQ